MRLKAIVAFTTFVKKGHDLKVLGLHGSAGDIMRFGSRYRLAKSFCGINLDSYDPKTIRGYDALFQIFLTHSALEQYLKVTGQKFEQIEIAHAASGAEKVIAQFFALDPKGNLVDFLVKHLNAKLQKQLKACQNGHCRNVGVLSASIRHIFAHGHLAAFSNKVAPTRLYRACKLISDFLLEYMEDEFTRRMAEYWQKQKSTGKTVPIKK